MKKNQVSSFNSLLVALIFAADPALAQTSTVPLKFDFGPGKVQKGYVQILPGTIYSKDKGYGFAPNSRLTGTDTGNSDALSSDFITSTRPFFFSVDLPDGNYDVSITFGDRNGTSSETVRAECRRLMVESFSTRQGEIQKKDFTVHMRSMDIGSEGKKVLINPREVNFLHWDKQLTFEFNGKEPKLCAIEIKKNSKAVTVFLAGNSTVVDQDSEPWGAWGQMIPVFFRPGKVSVANYAESGETFLAFKKEQRLEKIWSMARPGDYLFMEFAHNDQKAGIYHLDPFTTYKQTIKEWVEEARKRGIKPVLVTSMGRKSFDADGKAANTLGDYPEAMRQAGKENKVPVIDLNAMSMTMYTAWGPDNAGKGFVDGTHANTYGAWELAKCIAEGIKKEIPALAKMLKPDLKPFDPSKPDPFDALNWPPSGRSTGIKPPGN